MRALPPLVALALIAPGAAAAWHRTKTFFRGDTLAPDVAPAPKQPGEPE